ncbi:MAG: Maf family protein [Verrucomicrobiota bacterium]
MHLILASSSPRRQDLLRDAGFYFESEAPCIDEWDSSSHPDMSAIDLAQANARRKAEEVGKRHDQSIVLAADTIVYCEGQILGKPVDLVEARTMLSLLSGKTHEVITAVCWLDTRKKTLKEHVARTWVTFRQLSSQAIDAYLEKVHVLDKAGSYAAQERGEEIIERMEGSRTNVIGLPMEIVSEWWDGIG